MTPESLSEPVKAAEKARRASRRPEIDLGACSRCGGCIEVAPEVFRFCEGSGFVAVCDLDYYDAELVDEAIKFCPEDCIHWVEDAGGSD